MTPKATLDACFEMLVAAARAGDRCPTGDQIVAQLRKLGLSNIGGTATRELASAGHIRIEVGYHNWRVVKILTGEARGLETAYPPGDRPWKPYLTIGKDGIETTYRRLAARRW